MDDILNDENNNKVDFLEFPNGAGEEAATFSMQRQKHESGFGGSEAGRGKRPVTVTDQVKGGTTDVTPQVSRIHVRGDIKGSPRTVESITDEVRNTWIQQGEDILKLPSYEDGINMDRVLAYCDSIGFSRKPIRILSPEDYKKALTIAGKNPENAEDGSWLEQQDVIVVSRDPDTEAMNGSEFIESMIIHEAAHGNSNDQQMAADVSVNRHMLRKRVNVSTYTLRGGFVVRTDKDTAEGYLLEEGYAELERGIYVEQILGRKTGFTEGLHPGTPHLFDKYSRFVRDDSGEPKLNGMYGSVGAGILELLIKRDPELLGALRESRHSVQGLREVARRINEISPGLYQEMRKVKSASSEDASGILIKVSSLPAPKGGPEQE
jgi:hypothetical protein